MKTALPKALISIFLIVVVDVLGLTIILPLLPFYAEHLGASPTQVGLLVSTYALCQLIAGPMLGRLSDRIGRRPVLLLSQAGTLGGFVLLAYSNTLWLVFLSRIIDGLTAGNLSIAQAFIADVTTPEKRAKSFALIGIAFGVGFLIGPAMSGFLAQYGIRYPIFMAMALSATSIACTYFLLPANTHPAQDMPKRLTLLDWGAYARFWQQPGLGSLLWQFLAFIFSFSAFMSGFALFAERRFVWNGHPFGPREVGYVYAYVGVLAIILQGGLIGRLVDRLGEWKLVRIGFIVSVIGYAALGFTSTLPMLLFVSALTSFGGGVLRPALTSLITQQTSRSEQGSVLGLTQSLMSVSSIVAPFVAGLLIDHRWLVAWALLPAVSNALGLLLPKPVTAPAPVS